MYNRIKNTFTIKNTMLLLSFFMLIGLYRFFNGSERGINTIITTLDNNIPLIKWFVIPYVIWNIFIYFIALALMVYDNKRFVEFIITTNICLVICYFTYYFFQTTVPRPNIFGDDIFNKLILYIYYYDKPYNCFPSVHCITCVIQGIALLKSKFSNTFKVITVGTCCLIILSTLFIKQHVVMDAFSAIIIGAFVYNLVIVTDVIRVKKYLYYFFRLS